MTMIKKEEIEEIITALNTSKFYQSESMLQTKTNWLEHLTKALESYDNMPEGLEYKCTFISLIYYLHQVQYQSTRMYAETLKDTLTFTKTILDKSIDNKQNLDNKDEEKDKEKETINDTIIDTSGNTSGDTY